MTQRSGLNYRDEILEPVQTGVAGSAVPTDIQQVLQLLMEVHQKREKIAAKRRWREEEVDVGGKRRLLHSA